MEDTNKGIIAWFARNSVAANLLMIFIIVGGLLTAFTIRQQMFPQFEINWIQIQVQYNGAAPQEVEEGITKKIEESLNGIQGLKRVITYSNRGFSQTYIEVDLAYSPTDVMDEIKVQIDGISSFPDGMERPIIEHFKPTQEVMYISLHGDLDPVRLKQLGKTIHDEIQALPSINVSDLYDGLDYEIAIEVSQDRMREYNLSFRDIANAVRNFSANMSAGQIRAENGFISLRVENQAYRQNEFENLPLVSLEDGTLIYLGDVATVKDGLQEGIQYSKFNGQNSVTLFVGAANNQSINKISDIVNAYIDDKRKTLPQGVNLVPWIDFTYYLEGRLNMMLQNMFSGGLLVFLMLALFLRVRLAFWVMLGLPVAFLGTLFLMPLEFVNVTINITSLFGFILVLGVVVDDAIVIGESVSSEIEEHGHSVNNVIRGAQRVAVPATFGVLTTVAAFVPMILGDGPGSAFSKSIGFVVILCLLFSLVESKLILPAHLAHMKNTPPNPNNVLHRIRGKIDGFLKYVIEKLYRPFLTKAIHYRYTVIMIFIGILLLSVGLFQGGFMRYLGTPKIPHDFVDVNIEMNIDASERSTLDAALLIQDMIFAQDQLIKEEFGQNMVEALQIDLRSRTTARLMAKLVDPELRPLNSFELSERWRSDFPQIPALKSMTIKDDLFGGGRDDGDVSFRLTSKDDDQLEAAAMLLKAKLASIKGVGDVNDSSQNSTKEVQFELKPLAYSMGLTLADVASQVNFSFYGLEAQRILRNGEEIRVMVRYPEEQRNAIGHVEGVMIQTPNGAEVPLSEIAVINLTDGVSSIRRENGKRTINVWGSIDQATVEPFEVVKEINEGFMPELIKQYPKVSGETAGKIQEELDGVAEQIRNFVVSLMVIYALLAIPLRSYAQPLLIMAVIPFGIIGAMLGHMIHGLDMSSLSFFGIIAASGVVINDSLVMVDYVNQARARGESLHQAVIDSGCKRFRAIMLTSLTTFIGLVPIVMFETSLQAMIVIPMAVSLAYGVMFATFITLLLIPCMFVAFSEKWFNRNKRAPIEPQHGHEHQSSVTSATHP